MALVPMAMVFAASTPARASTITFTCTTNTWGQMCLKEDVSNGVYSLIWSFAPSSKAINDNGSAVGLAVVTNAAFGEAGSLYTIPAGKTGFDIANSQHKPYQGQSCDEWVPSFGPEQPVIFDCIPPP
jgi:hypothetical protein